MRYRLMAIYRGVPYEAGVGPTDRDVVLFAACPPPEDLGFQPAPGHWRKQVTRAEVDDVWESCPTGTYRDEPCIVLDDLGGELHIGYAGPEPGQAGRLGYYEVEPGVYEVVVGREDVTGITEERLHHALPRLGPLPGARPACGSPAYGSPAYGSPAHGGTVHGAPVPGGTTTGGTAAGGSATGGRATGGRATGGRATGGRAGRPGRPQTRETFTELADLAALPRDAYAVGAEADGAMCLVRTEAGFEVFVAQKGKRHEVRAFGDEEAAYFYLFGVLAAEAVRDGRLVPGAD